MPALPSLRFPGDGFDFRRPATGPATPNVIDLTNDNSPDEVQPQARSNARGVPQSTASQTPTGRGNFSDFIDLDGESAGATIDRFGETPDLELLEVRSVRSQPIGDAELRRRPDSRIPRSTLRPPTTVHHTEERPFTITPSGTWGAFRQHAQGRERQQQLAQQTARQFHQILHSTHQHPAADVLLRHEGRDTILPGDLDFITQGFHMGDAPVTRQTQAPLPTYDAPPPPHAGFTRSPKEDDVLVCPNCEDELGQGKDDVKRQVWVVKACGHVQVYCGECTKNRSPSKKGKATREATTKPFTRCVAEGCSNIKSIAGPKSLFQIYL
ncbi:MAG: hypothetical protein LQ345_000794 [Seirophora villosa]|nr:MAG: hypothetical protein LQ345_000794 [Seirophora villosa]